MRTVRIAHFGLGNFHRSHQAWYAQAHPDWGIAAFTGRSPGAARLLNAQGNRYGLILRGPEHDEVELIDSIVQAYSGDDRAALISTFTREELAVVTVTITEAGYLSSGGALTLDHPQAVPDLAALGKGDQPVSALARLTAGLDARRRADLPGVSVVCCDNLAGNDTLTRDEVLFFAGRIDAGLARWVGQECSFVRTSVDRITPPATASDAEVVRAATGFADQAPVVAEPFTSWQLSGGFAAARPPWELRGAQFVPDASHYERRKLLLLNGGHTVLATLGTFLGLATIAEAMQHPVCSGWLRQFWSEAAQLVPGDQQDYLRALESRFGNARIDHRLRTINRDVWLKIGQRMLPILQEGIDSDGALLVIATQAHLDGRPVGPELLGAADTPARRTLLNRLTDGLSAGRSLPLP